jgi:16S rRNA pseudouridine516 synthase
MRLDRFLSHSSGLSRKQVKVLLHSGAVQVDGQSVRNSGLQVSAVDRITLEGVVLSWPRHYYVMLHKPAGYVCSTEEHGHPLVATLLEASWAAGLHSAGRLDADTTGLVLLTSDGLWSHQLTSPNRGCDKTYLVGVKHPLQAELVQRFAEGIVLKDEPKPTRPARLEIIDELTARVTLHEGRYHQVKRMFAACSNRVETLHREAIGAITLDARLQAGQWRELSAEEIITVGVGTQDYSQQNIHQLASSTPVSGAPAIATGESDTQEPHDG